MGMRRDLGIVTIDGRRGTGKTRLAVAICRTYGAALVEVGPLFRLIAFEMQRAAPLTLMRASQRVHRSLSNGDLTFGPFDRSSPCGVRISINGKDMVPELWHPGLDVLLRKIAESKHAVSAVAPLVRILSASRPLVVVGRQAGSAFYTNAGLKFVLTSHDYIRNARKRAQLSRINGDIPLEIDSSEPEFVRSRDRGTIEIDTTDLRPDAVYLRVRSSIESELGWASSSKSDYSNESQMLSEAQSALRQFYKHFGLPIARKPKRLRTQRVRSIVSWIREEAQELLEAETIEGQADALADALYFAIGGFIELGLDASEVFRLVHLANMGRKASDGTVLRDRKSGKILKPPTWESPTEKIKKLLLDARTREREVHSHPD